MRTKSEKQNFTVLKPTRNLVDPAKEKKHQRDKELKKDIKKIHTNRQSQRAFQSKHLLDRTPLKDQKLDIITEGINIYNNSKRVNVTPGKWSVK